MQLTKQITLVFPHHLFKQHPALQQGRAVVMVEEYLFWRQYRFHKQKLAFHRASMQFYRLYLEQQGYAVLYLNATNELSNLRLLLPHLAAQGITHVHCCEPSDNWLQKRLTNGAAACGITPILYSSPLFLNTLPDLAAFFKDRKRYSQTDFYIHQRKTRGILLMPDGKPIGGKWSFDAENRQKYPKNKVPPAVNLPPPNPFHTEACAYVEQFFAHHYGSLSPHWRYPCTFDESEQWLTHFLQHRFAEFGVYEDAIVQQEHFLHHSVLTPMLNVGLLTPQQVLQTTLNFAEEQPVPLNSLEGFVRQIIGWREFIRAMYEQTGTYARNRNYWGFTRKIPPAFWQGNTGIFPIDAVVNKVLKTAYCHHIERLMVLGNFMLLCEFNPNEVYRWFMELFIDAYDWVMVPNVYGMSQFADGGLFATKPYLSSSNYLLKMSNFTASGGNWQPIWDALFWRFMHTHRAFFEQNPRLAMLLRTFDQMPAARRQTLLHTANAFLDEWR